MATSGLTVLSEVRVFSGVVRQLKHASVSTATDMVFSIFLPPQVLVADPKPVPVLYWLSGLTCTDQNFITKAGAQRVAAAKGIALVCPDTSPRGADIEGEEDGWDFGTGAGFYVNATQEKWAKNYNMYDYVVNELPSLVNASFPVNPEAQGIFGHSMGGHGALICALKNPGKYRSVSAFAPICNPTKCPWGEKAFTGYLGEDRETWKRYDATELTASYAGPKLDVLVDQGAADSFYTGGQLLPEALVEAAEKNDAVDVSLRLQEGYDHSYYFISTFVEDHIEHHARSLLA